MSIFCIQFFIVIKIVRGLCIINGSCLLYSIKSVLSMGAKQTKCLESPIVISVYCGFCLILYFAVVCLNISVNTVMATVTKFEMGNKVYNPV